MGALLETVPHQLQFTATIEPLALGDVTFHDIAEHCADRPDCALLESQGDHGLLGSYSFLSFSPFGRFIVRGHRSDVSLGGHAYTSMQDPFGVLDELLARHRVDASDLADCPPFIGGAIGYFGYELGRLLETLPETAVCDTGLPDCYLSLYNFTIVRHHESGALFLCHLQPVGHEIGVTRTEILAELAAVPAGLAAERAAQRRQRRAGQRVEFVSDLTKPEYIDAVAAIKEYIRAGDVYQVNMTQRFCAHIDGMRPWDIYRHLATSNPAPFAAFLHHDGHTIVSSSPERFVRVRGRCVETRPIKGTIARGATPEEDTRNRALLCVSTKNRAELAMIVDLLRNDLGRVCTPGSVRVQAFPEIESYASVHHLVATIVGELDEGRTITDLLKGTFPGGSITGCPKIRAMEIIDELEPVTRGVYTGSIGYLGFNGSADLNIAIRTVIVKDGKAHVHAGGGIVADSVEVDEYEESLLKAGRLLEAVRAVGAGVEP